MRRNDQSRLEASVLLFNFVITVDFGALLPTACLLQGPWNIPGIYMGHFLAINIVQPEVRSACSFLGKYCICLNTIQTAWKRKTAPLGTTRETSNCFRIKPVLTSVENMEGGAVVPYCSSFDRYAFLPVFCFSNEDKVNLLTYKH